MRKFVCASAAALAGLAASAMAEGPVIYSQAPYAPTGIFSDAVPGQYYDQKIADDFTLGGASVINGVRWWGSSENFVFPDYTNFAAFEVTIYSDAGGLPGAPIIGPLVVPTAATAPVDTGSDNPGGANIYEQELKFQPTTLAGGRYWVSIGTDNVAPGDDGWIWQNSLGTFNGAIAAQIPVGAPWAGVTGFGDMAFEIQGIPEPASLALLALGSLVAFRRR